MIQWRRWLACLAALAGLAGLFSPADADPPRALKNGTPIAPAPPANAYYANIPANTAPSKDGASGGAVKVAKGPFKIEVSLNGVLESADMAEVVLRPEAWSTFSVVKAVEPGTVVKKGEQLVWLEMDKIDQAIQDLETERAISDLALKQARKELPILEQSTPLDLKLAEEAKRHADEDLKKFLTVDRALSEKSAEFMVKNAAHYLEYAKEELRQLEKMYRAHDIREETEEIIVRRQRHAVESSAFNLEQMQVRRDQTLKVDLPRQEQGLKDHATKQALTLERARVTLPLTLGQKRLALAKMEHDHVKAADKLHKMQQDREAMVVRAPADGVVYYGKCTRGQWTTASTVAGKLQRGGSLMGDEVFMTVVKPRPLFIRATVDEKDLPYLHAGLKGKAAAVALAGKKLAAQVEHVSAAPAGGSYEARLAVQLGPDAGILMPGMTCSVKLVPYAKPDAIALPASLVRSDDLDEDQHFVWVAGKGGKPEKRAVTVGQTAGDKTEIVRGLTAGEQVLPDGTATK